ncbi:alpha/beta fold hydrolase [Novosphingobium sp. KN65.2]|uniref:alpha/beta fold hydrolase n=1 Tax=Novosphingobium sp. KN65.2 TaxID=1478134 RepID=UPI0005E91271|nr:alpha/beta hydrolase [Novosphingobium sp. KN65.2]CDO36251.1 non-heme chloroperoxidase (Chloride peroxidase) (CPO-P) (Chloroperoxidase P) [Novosphingobium sp. KN65.2]
MATMKTKDGTKIFFKDWGSKDAQPIVFSHGWPLSADVWDPQMAFFAGQGFRTIAHDRRSHGRSDQVWDNNTMDQYADDLAELIETLDLHDAILVGHSTGGGEVTRYVGRHGTKRVAKVALIGAVPPLMLKTEANPGGQPIEAFDAIRKGTFDNRSQFFLDVTTPFYGFNRDGASVSEGLKLEFWRQGMMGGLKGQLDSIRAFSESDFHEDLAKLDRPTLVLHGDDDQIVPIGASALETVKIVKDAVLMIYKGADHGLTQTHQDRFNADLLNFIRE